MSWFRYGWPGGFGVTTALVSIVLSVFMGGLGVGSWIAGTLVRRYRDQIRFHPLRKIGGTLMAFARGYVSARTEILALLGAGRERR